jgi:hypothetical protein
MCCPTSSAPPPSSASRITRRRCRPPRLPAGNFRMCILFFIFGDLLPSGINFGPENWTLSSSPISRSKTAQKKSLLRRLSLVHRLGPLHCPFSFLPNHFQPSLLLYSYIKQMSRIRLGLFVSFLIYEVFPIHYADGQ